MGFIATSKPDYMRNLGITVTLKPQEAWQQPIICKITVIETPTIKTFKFECKCPHCEKKLKEMLELTYKISNVDIVYNDNLIDREIIGERIQKKFKKIYSGYLFYCGSAICNTRTQNIINRALSRSPDCAISA
jgi:hypothetical protein